MLGTHLGDTAFTSDKLVARVRKRLAPLAEVVKLRDTANIRTALQVQLEINRFCANTQLIYFMRTMPLEATAEAARVHDELVIEAAMSMLNAGAATASERALAAQQLRLPVRLGGLGLTSMASIAGAAVVGTWALCWHQVRALCPWFADVDIATVAWPSAAEFRTAHRNLRGAHRLVAHRYAEWERNALCYTKDGVPQYRFHPSGLPPAATLLPVSAFALERPEHQHAQRRYSQVVHHAAWYEVLALAAAAGPRELVRFVAASQPYAGAFLNAVPSRPAFRMPTWALLYVLQRRLGLPCTLVAAASHVPGAEQRSKHGHVFDLLGDAAQCDGAQGHQTRHYLLLKCLHQVFKSLFKGRLWSTSRKTTRCTVPASAQTWPCIPWAGGCACFWGTSSCSTRLGLGRL